MAVQLVTHDYEKNEQLIFGPYSQIDILPGSVWAHDISGRKFRVADKDPVDFWVINDEGGHFLVRVRELWIRSMVDEASALDEEKV